MVPWIKCSVCFYMLCAVSIMNCVGNINAAGAVDSSQAWGAEGGGPPGYIAVDEARGWIYGLERNLKSGAFYRWPVEGGVAEWLNYEATGARDPIQYLSDGPVANLDMANPFGVTVDEHGYVYIDDDVRNKLFGTWPSILTFDRAGNGYFGYSVWPRLVRLRRVN